MPLTTARWLPGQWRAMCSARGLSEAKSPNTNNTPSDRSTSRRISTHRVAESGSNRVKASGARRSGCVNPASAAPPPAMVPPFESCGSTTCQTVLPPPDVSLTKTGSVPSLVQGQGMSFTLTATNNSTTTPAPNVSITDTFNAVFNSISGFGASCSGWVLYPTVTCRAGYY